MTEDSQSPNEKPAETREEELDSEDAPEEAAEEDSPETLSLPEPVEAALEEIPPDQREKVRSTFLGLSQYMGPMPHPLLGKLTEGHLHKLIDGAENDNKRSYDDRDKHRSHVRLLALAGMLTFVVVAWLFLSMEQTGLLENLIQLGVVFAGGMGVGVGFLRRRSE